MYISSFNISGYRSLKDVKIPGMLPVCIFHGLNNTGKSNILAALETIFRRKLSIDETTTAAGVTSPGAKESSFWHGQIAGFKDDFFQNGREDITFAVDITFSDSELDPFRGILSKLKPSLKTNIKGRLGKVPQVSLLKKNRPKVLRLEGRITYRDENSANMVLQTAVFNREYIVYSSDRTGKRDFFPTVSETSSEEKLRQFDQLMGLLANSFALMPADRYLTGEHLPSEESVQVPLTAKTFKQWLFSLSLSREGHSVFEAIRSIITSAPFPLGEISFCQEGREIEIMVKDRDIRLPVSRLGSGHQQLLYIVAHMVFHQKKMLGIEELEINLSPVAQRRLFEKLKSFVYQDSGLISQVIITSHSDCFARRQDVRCYSIEHDGQKTVVNSWTQAAWNRIFSPSVMRQD